MFRKSNLEAFPQHAASYLESCLGQTDLRFRRRAVLARSADREWGLVCCTVEVSPGESRRPKEVRSRRYEQVALYEDWLSAHSCIEFIDEVQNGRAAFGDVILKVQESTRWGLEPVPLANNYMPRAGYVVETQFGSRQGRVAHGPLLEPDEPYYPDLAEAARDWLPLTSYHGDHDGRNQHIMFLMPEYRAYFANAVLVDGGLELRIDGTNTDQLVLVVKGAYWLDDLMSHFDCSVVDGKAVIEVPDAAERLEYVLMDSDGITYDFQREDKFNHSGLGRRHLAGVEKDLVGQVKAACVEGEGAKIEFKPFVDFAGGIGKKSNKTKFRELITTVVSFANTKGGRIYIGIDDECCVSDISSNLKKWAKSEIKEPVNRYQGALTGRIRDHTLAILHCLFPLRSWTA